MKYLITEAQRDFLIEQMRNARNDQPWLNELKPIEPLSDKDIRQMWEDAWDSTEKGWIFPIYARAVEAHILGEQE